MKLYYPITVDLYKPYPLPLVEAQQNNIGRGVLVTLTAQGAVITPTGESIQLYAKKPDGTISYLACTLTGSQIECDFTNQMLALPGMVQVELQMIGGESGAETEITTPIFCVKVNPSNVDDSAVESQDEFPALVTALAEVAELKANGLKGDPGEAATIQIGDVTASDPGSNPKVTNSGTEQNAILNFVLPRGQQGPQGIPGEGVTFGAYSSFPNPGQANVLYVDNTVNPARAYVWNGTAYVPAGGGIPASSVTYNNESSELTADTVQEAIDENAAAIKSLNSSLSVKSEEIVRGVWLDQNGHEATLRFRLGERSFAPNQWNTICTLPEGVRPVGPINFVLYDNLLNNNEEQRPILCEISGENVNIYAFADKITMAPYGSGTFIFENRDPET